MKQLLPKMLFVFTAATLVLPTSPMESLSATANLCSAIVNDTCAGIQRTFQAGVNLHAGLEQSTINTGKWIQKNPNTTMAIALGIASVSAYAIYKICQLYNNYKVGRAINNRLANA